MPTHAERISASHEETELEGHDASVEAHSPGGTQAHTLLSASVEADAAPTPETHEAEAESVAPLASDVESDIVQEAVETGDLAALTDAAKPAKAKGKASVGGKVLGGLKQLEKPSGMALNTLLGPLQFLRKSYRKDQSDAWSKNYGNPALMHFKISVLLGQVGSVSAWGGLITGLAAAILAATGVGVPIAASFAAASSILCFTATVSLAANAGVKSLQSIGGLIQSTAYSGKEASAIRWRALNDLLQGMVSLGGAMVGGYMAQANGGSFASPIESQVNTANSTAAAMSKQGGGAVQDFGLKSLAGQGFNNAGDILLAGGNAAEESIQTTRDSDGDSQDILPALEQALDEAESAVHEEQVQNTRDTQSIDEVLPQLEETVEELQELSSEDPATRAESAMNGDLDPVEEHIEGEEEERPLKERVEGYGDQLDKSESAETEAGDAAVEKTAREAEEAQKESRKQKKKPKTWWGRLKSRVKRFFKGIAKRAKKKAAEVPKKLISIEPSQVEELNTFKEHLEQDRAERPQLEAALDQEAALIQKIKDHIPDTES